MLKVRSIKASRWVVFGSVLGALPASLSGCGGAKVPVASPAPLVATPAPVAKEELPDLSPVAAPPDLVALARFKQPKTAVETTAAWANFPFKLHDVLPPELSELERVVAWDAPLEAALALDPLGEGKVPEPLAVVSVGLTSLDGALELARAKGQSVRKLRAGVYRVGDSEEVSCAVGLSVGSAPARLVCGHRAHDVDGLFDYATRGLPSEPLPKLDFQIELRLSPIKKKYEAELGSARMLAGFLLRKVQLDNPRFDRALSDVTYGLVDEATAFVHDLDRVRLDSSLDGAKNLVDLHVQLKFAGQKSWLVQASTESLSMVEPAPELFWQLPADSTAAGFSVGWKPGRLKPIGHTLADLLDGYLDSEHVPAGFRQQVAQSVELLFDQNTKQVRAQGDLSVLPADPLLAADYRVFGWQIAAVDGDPKRVSSLFDGLTKVLGGRDLARLLKQRLGTDAALFPKFSAHPVKVRGYAPNAQAYRMDIPRDVFEKYAKSQMGVALAPAKGKQAAKSVPLTLIVATDGGRSWLGVCPDEQALIQRLESLKDPNRAVLRSRPGLESLAATPRAAGGFVTLARFGGQLAALARRGARDAEANQLIVALPHHGETPILFSYDVSSNGPELGTSFTVPRAAVEDLGALVPALALMAKWDDAPAP